MTKEELLEHAKKNYPIGTVFKEAYTKTVYTVLDDYTDPNKNNWLNSQTFIIRVKELTGSGAYVYKDGKWAEIVSKPEEISQFEVGKLFVNGFAEL